MARKNNESKAVVTIEAEAPVMEVLQEEVAAETTEAQEAEVATEATTQESEVETKKRVRNYSQSAIDVEDLERLNGFKSLIKEKLNMSVSNQRILSAALNCLANNVEEFMKELATEAHEKQKAKDMKTLAELKAKLGVE